MWKQILQAVRSKLKVSAAPISERKKGKDEKHPDNLGGVKALHSYTSQQKKEVWLLLLRIVRAGFSIVNGV
ncbi:MAG: hypothetical protein JJ939_15825 [Alphaproteobacteria bacterium]|nr:hypothetical protein [Alphaproteobacteria bacterium]